MRSSPACPGHVAVAKIAAGSSENIKPTPSFGGKPQRSAATPRSTPQQAAFLMISGVSNTLSRTTSIAGAVALKQHEATEDITTVVQATVRVCPADVPGAPDRAGGVAHRRSRPRRGDSRQNLRHLPAHPPPREDGKAGYHYRYRRSEPGETRAVSLAADPDRGSDHESDQARRRRDRVRHRILRARPAQSGRRG